MASARTRAGAFALVGTLMLVGAGNAQAATKTVFAGPAGAAGGIFAPHSPAEPNQFSQQVVTIHVGDSVRWVLHGFHTVTFPKPGTGDVPFVAPNPLTTYSGFTDAAGLPFWFNGKVNTLDVNPAGGFPQGGRTVNGSRLVGSGVPLGPPKPYVLKFTKAGTFTYECVIHHGMEAKVRVLGRHSRIPSAKADAAVTAKRLAAQARAAKALLNYTPPVYTVTGGHDSGQIALLKFFPSTLHVPIGGAVTFSVHSSTEIHTFSFGPAAYLGKIANDGITPIPNPHGPPTLRFNPLSALPSDPPPLPSYDGSAHGNGFLSTGTLGGDPHAPTSATVRFTKAGTYNYICLIHDFMHGSIIVG